MRTPDVVRLIDAAAALLEAEVGQLATSVERSRSRAALAERGGEEG
ncbi:MAG: hypothetical protein IPM13_10410 [Phycisphaerales bacterium]|nr:hypothetical protein [Phycisphaerales bacterium]